jgi:hypothetical protein
MYINITYNNDTYIKKYLKIGIFYNIETPYLCGGFYDY